MSETLIMTIIICLTVIICTVISINFAGKVVNKAMEIEAEKVKKSKDKE